MKSSNGHLSDPRLTGPVLAVAVPCPLPDSLDYLPPEGVDPATLAPGVRLRVPFGRRRLVGVLVAVLDRPRHDPARLRRAEAVLDREPLVGPRLQALAHWAAAYYHHPPGEVFAALLPVRLRQGAAAELRPSRRWRLTRAGAAVTAEQCARAPRQWALLARLGEGELADEAISGRGERASLRRLIDKGWVAPIDAAPGLPPLAPATPPEPEAAQRTAIEAITAALGGFDRFLLEGVTGSGKTEVYLRAIQACLARGEQALLLVPEIGLTPQLVSRLRRRLDCDIAVLHSALPEGERLNAWLAAARGEVGVVVGTRSAVFTPLARPGLFLIDEEHDASFKQQDGFRYSARDLLIRRAQLAGVPVVLGSATPSLESLYNAERGRYRRLHLPERAGGAESPPLSLIDVRAQPMDEGLSLALRQRMHETLAAGNQVLLFLNRRGFAPVLLCHQCGWVAHCERCDAHLTLHQRRGRLHCHHCDHQRAIPAHCPQCGSAELRAVGTGTERVEQALQTHFPGARILRIDRDSSRGRGVLEAQLESARKGEAQILLGTQMLAKGHHFPGVTLVGILDADQGLFGADFRAGERLAQQIVQVAGRAGRAERPGEVLIQTHHPEHPLLRQLVEGGYAGFAQAALAARAEARLPPFSHLALLRAEAPDAEAARAFLGAAAGVAGPRPAAVELWGPVPAPMERRAGRYRFQLLVQAASREALHPFLDGWLPEVGALREGRRVRWSLDVDPQDMY